MEKNHWWIIIRFYRSVNQPGGSNSRGPKKRESASSFSKHNKVSASINNSHDNGKRHSNASQGSKEKILSKKDSGSCNAAPKTQVSAVTGSRSHVENSQIGFGGGLQASFASLRRSSATPDLLNSSSVFDASSEVQRISSKPSSAGSSASRIRRPPTKESRSVSICETDVCRIY